MRSDKRSTKAGKVGCLAAGLISLGLLGAVLVPGLRPVQARYFFPSDAFSESEIEEAGRRVGDFIDSNYEKADGKLSGSDWILRRFEVDISDKSRLIYFGETMSTDGYSIGVSGKGDFRKFASDLEDIFEIESYNSVRITRTSKLKKFLQFVKSEI